MKTQLIRLFAAFLLLQLTVSHANAEQAVRFDRIREVISNWDADQHLYVKGDVGMSRDQLSELERWLDENASHWVVVLQQNSKGESYRAADGRVYQEIDAVEHALGHGLANQTDFGKFEDARVKEADGAILVISLEDRALSYYSSDAQDRRRLGQSNWLGELDQDAARALRNGLRIRDAVQGTITSINRRVQQTIDKEFASAEQAEKQRKEAYQQIMIRMAAMGEDIALVKGEAARFRAAFPDASAELTEPPVTPWHDELTLLENKLTDENIYDVSQDVTSLHDRLAEYLNAYSHIASFDEDVAALEKRLDPIASASNGVAKPTVEEARRLIEQARTDRAAGRFDFASSLAEANDFADQGADEVAAEIARSARKKRINQVIRKTAAGTGLLTAGGLGILGFVLSRKRRPIRQQARTFLKERQESVDREVQRVFKLLERSGEVLGSKDRIKDRGYEGTTKTLSEKTFDNVDDLIVMSSEVERVMDEAKTLIHPQSPISKAVNVFSGSRYAQGIEQISGKPLEFRRDKGLPLALDEDGEASAGELDADGNPPESIRLTFEDVFARFHDRSDRATETLNRIESSLLEVNDGLTALQTDIDVAVEEEKQLAAMSEEDGYFQVPAYFESLLQSALTDYDRADAISGSDPVTAVSDHLPLGGRKIAEASHLCASIRRAHEQVLPSLKNTVPLLEAAGYDAAWVDDRLEEMTEHANQLFAKAAIQSVANEVMVFNHDVDALAIRATRCLEISKQLESELRPSVEQLSDRLGTDRKVIAGKLKLLPSQILREKPRDPDDDLAAARQQIEVVKAAIHSGNVEVANEAVSNLQREAREGNSAIDDTHSAVAGFDSMLRTRQEEATSTRAQLSAHESSVEEVRREYAASTYRLQATDPTFPSDEATIDSHINGCRDHLAEAERLLKLSREFFDKGRVLEATAMLDAVNQDVEMTNQMYQDLDEHVGLLEEMTRSNEAELAKLASQIDRMSRDVSERRTTRPTVEFFQDKVQAVQAVAHEVESQKESRDPIGVATRIEKLAIEFEEVDARVAADRNAHAEANRAVDGATAQLASGRRLIRRARQDGIPDSRATSSLVQEIESYDSELNEIRRRLDIAHDNWKDIHEKAVVFHSNLGESTGRLRGELQRASSASESLESASRTVFEAARWTGGWGVRIFGSAGSKELERARAALQNANYAGTIELSRAASMVAGHAIQKARREVARRQRDQMRQAERRRRQRSIRIGSGGSIFRGGGGSSRRVSSGRSRSRSKGNSGFSRSSW